MTIHRGFTAAFISLGACLLASQAQAIAITDVNLQLSGGGSANPSAAELAQNKPKKAKINALTGLFAGDPWTLLDKSNKPSKTFQGVDFVLTADTGQRSGDWQVSWGAADLPLNMDFVLVLKSGEKWGAYLFEAGSFSDPSGIAGGDFDISWLNKHGKTPKLQKASIFGRVADATLPPGDIQPGSSGGSSSSSGGETGSSSGTTSSSGGETGSSSGTTSSSGGETGSRHHQPSGGETGSSMAPPAHGGETVPAVAPPAPAAARPVPAVALPAPAAARPVPAWHHQLQRRSYRYRPNRSGYQPGSRSRLFALLTSAWPWVCDNCARSRAQRSRNTPA
ncbi:MAG: hypothetical protein R3E50_17200 [Halioglobus sp.]